MKLKSSSYIKRRRPIDTRQAYIYGLHMKVAYCTTM